MNMEKKIETQDWMKRANHSSLSICVVDSWLLYKNGAENPCAQQDLYCRLAEELIHNSYGAMVTRQRTEDQKDTHIVVGDTTVTNRKRLLTVMHVCRLVALCVRKRLNVYPGYV